MSTSDLPTSEHIFSVRDVTPWAAEKFLDIWSEISIFFMVLFYVSQERPAQPLETPSSKCRIQRDEQGEDILFSDFIPLCVPGVYSSSLKPDVHGGGCDYRPLSCSALI